VVGASATAGNATSHAFSWTATGGIEDLGTLDGIGDSTAAAVNPARMIVGTSWGQGGLEPPGAFWASDRAAVWTRAGGWVDLEPVELTDIWSEAVAVSESGQVAGTRGVPVTVPVSLVVVSRAIVACAPLGIRPGSQI